MRIGFLKEDVDIDGDGYTGFTLVLIYFRYVLHGKTSYLTP